MSRPNLLLIEDDLSTASALQKVLEAEGYAVTCAGRGDEGLRLATALACDLVITI